MDSTLPTLDQLPGAHQHLTGVSESAMRGSGSDPGRQEHDARERIRTDLESHISTSFDVTTNAGYELAHSYVRHRRGWPVGR